MIGTVATDALVCARCAWGCVVIAALVWRGGAMHNVRLVVPLPDLSPRPARPPTNEVLAAAMMAGALLVHSKPSSD